MSTVQGQFAVGVLRYSEGEPVTLDALVIVSCSCFLESVEPDCY